MGPAWLATISAAYVAALFAIAWLGDRRFGKGATWLDHPVVAGILFSLTVAVYNTSWSFYGSVGEAARTGWGFLPIYVAPLLLITLGRPLLRRLIDAAETQEATSVADFLATRYGARQSIAALVTIGSLPAVLPYISLQLRAVAASFELLSGTAAGPKTLLHDTALWLAVAMAALIVVFGVRHVHRSERHRGLMIAVAFDSTVKLVAFLAVSSMIVADFAWRGSQGAAAPLAHLPLRSEEGIGFWLSRTAIAGCSFLCLPHMFHVLAVERTRPTDLTWAGRLFPLYLALLSLLMVPVARIGVAQFGGVERADTFMIALPMLAGRGWLAVVAYLGGLSAATGMVIVATLALATMLCNDVMLPLLLRGQAGDARPGRDVSSLLLAVRRVAVVAVLLLAFAMNRLVSQYHLAQTGLVSFVGVAQFGPALLAGLYWRRASGAGAVAGIAGGLALWGWLLLAPGVAPGRDPIVVGSAVSLLANIGLLVLVSLAVPIAAAPGAGLRPAQLGERELRRLAIRYVGRETANAAFDAAPGGTALTELTRNLLAGAIGTASARVVIAAAGADGSISGSDARIILDEASNALRQNHELLRTVLDTMPQGICIFDADCAIVAWNANFLRLLEMPPGIVRVGLPLGSLLDHNLSRARYAGSDPRNLLAADLVEAHRWPYVYERERPDGTVIEIAFDRLAGGGLVSTYSDVTERHRAALSLRQANDALEARVRQRTDELERATADAEAANRAKTRFLAAAGHDLLQPIHAARLFLATLETEKALSAAGADAVVHAGAAIQSSEAMVHGISDLSAIESGTVVPCTTRVDVGQLLGELGRAATVIGREAGIAVSVCSDSAHALSDPAMLRRIVQNYLSNALQRSGAGRVVLRCRRRGAAVEIQVWDDGRGIARDKRRAIFEEFSRGEGSSGMGLGLAIVRRMAEMLGHDAGVLSSPGRGSCFRIRARADVGVVAGGGMAVAKERAASTTARVLCIEDDALVRTAMAGLLRRWGFVVEETPAGTPPDVIVADYHLTEGMTGVTVYDRLSNLWQRRVPLILVTADRSTDLLSLADARGFQLLHKPVEPERLRAALANAA